MPSWKKVITSGSNATLNSLIVTSGVTITGSLVTTGSNSLIGTNTLLGNTTVSGSVIISGSSAPGSATASVQIYGDIRQSGYHRFDPVTTNINASISASYIYVSGSTNDLYFSQNNNGYNNITRLRWMEGNLYTGLLHGGIITTQSSTVYQVSSGSGVIVSLNTSFTADPYPTIQFLQWSNLSASIASLSASYDQQFVSIDNTTNIQSQGTPYTDGDYNTKIPIGIVIHQNRSTINAVQTFPGVAYGWKQRSHDFIKAFGPLKISGYTLSPSGSSTGSLYLSGGTAWVDGRNYIVNPNEPSYITEATGIVTSKIYRYYQSGSGWVYDTNAGVGYPIIDPANYSNNGVLTPVGTNDWTIQRVFYFPNSATKSFYIYYGNATYSSKDNAIAGILTETFNEAPNTAANAIFVGYMILRYNANFTTAASYEFRAGGLFRSSGAGGGGGGGGTTLPGGSATQIQYNNSSTFGGVPTLTYDGTLLRGTGSFSGSFTGNLVGTSSFASTATTASYATQALSASYAPSTPTFPYTGSAEITGSLGVTGSFSVLDSIDATNKILIGSGPIPGSIANSVDWGSRTLFDTNGNFSVRWGLLRSLYDANASQSVDWNNRLLKFDNGPGDYTVNWNAGLLRDTGSTNSVDWQNRITIDTGNKTSIDWQNRQLKDSNGNETLNWQSGVKITGSLTVSGSSTFTNIGPARFSGSFVVQGDLIPGFPPFIPDIGPYDAIKVDDIAGQRILYGSPLQGASASIDFGNRTLFDNNASDTISWGGTGGEFSTFKYNAQQISATTRDNLYSNNRQGGQFLNDSYFDINVVDNDLVYLNTDGQWYQVDQTTNSSTKMLGIAKSVSSQTGSVLIEGDIVVTTGTGYPAVANAGYGAPIYIKQGAGTAMDTTTPTSGYIRLLGYCYASYNGGTDWIMKFRPSNEWYVI